MSRTIVLIPGILASGLYAGSAELWGEDIGDNYERILHNSAMLNWSDDEASKTSFLTEMSVRILKIPFKVHLWKAVLEHLQLHREFKKKDNRIEFSYDWRQSLTITAHKLGQTITAIADAKRKGNANDSPKFVFLTHSMGGVLLRIAIGLKHIPSDLIESIINIGAPLKGSPAAFRGTYDSNYLPNFELFSRYLVWPYFTNKDQFFYNLLRNFQTFPSLYQLLPREKDAFIRYSGASLFNPLAVDCIPAQYRQHADDAHKALDAAKTVLDTTPSIKVYTIFTESNPKHMTDQEYEVCSRTDANGCYYSISNATRTERGDGTVLAESAKDFNEKPVTNVIHYQMCNDNRIVDVLKTIPALVTT